LPEIVALHDSLQSRVNLAVLEIMNAPLPPPPAIEPATRTQDSTPLLRLRLIGLMEARTASGASVLPVGRKTRALLAIVALSAPRPALRSRLAELLWSRRPEEQARASLRQEVHRLNESLSPAGEEILVVTRDHVTLHPGRVWVDAREVMSATRQNPAPLALLDGELLEDLHGIDAAFDAWLNTERERLRDRGRALAELILRDQNDPEAAIPAAQRLLRIDRAHEGAWRALMRAHADRGERGLAIQAYDRCRTALAEMLDAAPSAETQKLLGEIRGPAIARLPLRPPAVAVEPAESPEEPELRPPGPARGGAHLGVMPLGLIGTTTPESDFAIGLAEEISAALSRIRWLFVVSPSSLTRFSESGRDEVAIRRTFGLDLLLDGTIQRVGTKLRIAVRLLDLRHGGEVAWAGRFDREDDDALALQDEVAALIAAQIESQVTVREARRVLAQPTDTATAYELMLRAFPAMHRMERAPFMTAETCLRRAIELEPDFAVAHAWLAVWHLLLMVQGWADPAEVAEEAGRLADRAIRLDPFDARVLTLAAQVRAMVQWDLPAAAALHERALSVNPNQSMGWAMSAATQVWLGDTAEADRRLRRYKALTPLHPCAFAFDGAFAMLHLLQRDFERAAAAGVAAIQMNPALCANHKPYLAALAYLGRTQEAAAARTRLLALEPGFNLRRFRQTAPFAREEDLEIIVEGLQLAGIPEDESSSI
jgi:DNA-binding SARP family transcriptional activator/TolB-like protein